MNKYWWKVDNLLKQEGEIKKAQDISSLNTKVVFGSYKKVLSTNNLNDANLEAHIELNPENKLLHINQLLNIAINENYKILDAGCGLGFTSDALRKLYKNSTVTGIDISEDGINFAKKTFPNCNFLCNGIDPDHEIIDKFNLIYCFEFYPFSRTTEWSIHKSYINYFLKNLSSNGKLIIYQMQDDLNSISANYKFLKEDFFNHNIQIHKGLSKKLINLYKYIPSYKIIGLIDGLCRILVGHQMKIIIIENN